MTRVGIDVEKIKTPTDHRGILIIVSISTNTYIIERSRSHIFYLFIFLYRDNYEILILGMEGLPKKVG